MIDISKAINALNIDKWVLRGTPTNEAEFNAMFRKLIVEDESSVAIESSDPADFGVTWAEITAKITELEADYTAKQYQRDRAEAYPPIAEQLDQIYHEGIDAWKETIAAVKAEYPKP